MLHQDYFANRAFKLTNLTVFLFLVFIYLFVRKEMND